MDALDLTLDMRTLKSIVSQGLADSYKERPLDMTHTPWKTVVQVRALVIVRCPSFCTGQVASEDFDFTTLWIY